MRWVGVAGVCFAFACGGAQGIGGEPDGGPVGGISPDGGPDAGPDGGPVTTTTPPDGTTTPPDAGPLKYSWPPPRQGYVNPIPAENAKAGDPNWQKGYTNAYALQIEAYADRVSASPGDTVNLMVRSAGDSTASWSLYRIGYYNNAGASRAIGRRRSASPFPATRSPVCISSASSGRITSARSFRWW
jgi:hypothetical protein